MSKKNKGNISANWTFQATIIDEGIQWEEDW
jgi:hypothetical protein